MTEIERRDSDQRLTRVETVVENLSNDVAELTSSVKQHVIDDRIVHGGLHKEINDGRLEMSGIARDVKHIATSVHENATEVKKLVRIIAMMMGAGVAIGVIWTVFTFVVTVAK